MGLAPLAMDYTAESISHISHIIDNLLVMGNATLWVESLCTSGRTSINFYFYPNPVARAFFVENCLCDVVLV